MQLQGDKNVMSRQSHESVNISLIQVARFIFSILVTSTTVNRRALFVGRNRLEGWTKPGFWGFVHLMSVRVLVVTNKFSWAISALR